MDHKTFILCILDGWGYSKNRDNNAIAHAQTPFFDYAMSHYPWSLLDTSGPAVGLPHGQMGNSESGHMTIGTGQIIQQYLVRIDQAIATNQLITNPYIQQLIQTLTKTKGTCHLMGLISDGGVHSHINHMIAIAGILKQHNIPVLIHGITDGRDVPPRSVSKFIATLEDHGLEIATLSGRYYAMDRDNRTERTEQYYNAIATKQGAKFEDASEVIAKSYAQDINDEFIVPAVQRNYDGIKSNDALVCTNFRADRVRQILNALLIQNPSQMACALGMVSYSSELSDAMPSIFPQHQITHCLGSVIAQQKHAQLRLAETEKYAHVTYFFNGGEDIQYPLEDRMLIPSPKVSSYDLEPEMSAHEITAQLIGAISAKKYRFICVNFANADMVGHTGNFDATVRACEVLDNCLAEIYPILKQHGAEILITADHGNAEQMFDTGTDQPLTSHTTNPVPLIYIGDRKIALKNGGLSDIAPTILNLMGVDLPQAMTGKSLLYQIPD